MSPTEEIDRLGGGFDRTPAHDSKERPPILFENDYALQSTLEREETIKFHEIAS